jgi:guanine deaminase
MTYADTIYRGCVLHARGPSDLEVIEDGCLMVGKGKVVGIGPSSLMEHARGASIVDCSGQLIVPGFVDAHVHLPQHVFAGLGAKELLDWLKTYTFPVEARFSEAVFAQNASNIFFRDLVRNGTTTAAIYATRHTEATDVAFEAAEKSGIRAVLGKVLMERNGSADLDEDGAFSLRECEALAEKWHGRDGRLFFAVTPRFAITCGENTLKAAAALAHKRNLHIQTHLSENPGEIDFTLSLFPGYKDYTEIYERCGLLTSKTLLAHGIHLTEGERQRIRSAGASIVHCATSNRYLQSGVFGIREAESSGVSVALGSDVAGGYEISMLHEMREAIETSKSWNVMHRSSPREVLSVAEAFHRATLGGAAALGMDHVVGNFVAGKDADFLVLNDSSINQYSNTGLFQTPEERLARLIYRADSSCVAATFVRGRRLSQ